MNAEAAQLHVSDEVPRLLERIDGIAPILSAEAEESETIGRLTDRTFSALEEIGVFRLSLPQVLGGYEASPRQVIEVLERLSYWDASAGWATMALQMSSGITGAYLESGTASQLFNPAFFGRMAGQGNRMGTARRVEDGYEITGEWNFASGLLHATHVHAAAITDDTGQKRIFVVPKNLSTVEANWDVMGLKGTGSVDYSLDHVVVPEAASFELTSQVPVQGGSFYRLGLPNMAGINHSGWALGVGRRLLDEMNELAKKKSGAPGATTDSDEFHAEYARAEAGLRSARSFVMDVWRDNEESLSRGEALSVHQETLSRLALHNATWAAQAASVAVYKWAGTSALRNGDIQRFFRDMQAGTQHVTSGPAVLQACGRMLAGLAPGSRWSFGTLVSA